MWEPTMNSPPYKPTSLSNHMANLDCHEFHKFRSLTKIAAMKHEQTSNIFIWLLLFCASVAQFGGIIVAIDMHRVLLQRKATLTVKTYNLQKMLQKALI